MALITTAQPDAAAIYARYMRVVKWYKDKHDKTRVIAIAAARTATREAMEHKTKGLKKMAAAIHATPPRPLMHTKRDRVGPNGQAIGTITTDPAEVDGIATRKWQQIYQGNPQDLRQSATAFM